jgi:hypothetical protein
MLLKVIRYFTKSSVSKIKTLVHIGKITGNEKKDSRLGPVVFFFVNHVLM